MIKHKWYIHSKTIPQVSAQNTPQKYPISIDNGYNHKTNLNLFVLYRGYNTDKKNITAITLWVIGNIASENAVSNKRQSAGNSQFLVENK